MEIHHYFLTLLIVLLSARIFTELAVILKIPPVIGELLAGVVIGPSLLGWVEAVEAIKLLAEIGIIMLLFEVGLETDIKNLAKTGFKSFVVALMGLNLPFLFAASLAYWFFKLPLLTALFIGGTLTATSIGITLRVLSDLKHQDSTEGQIVLGAAVLDDILGVVLLALLYEFSIGAGINVMNAAKVLLSIVIFFVLAPFAAKMISFAIHRMHNVSEAPGLIPSTIVSLMLFFAWLAHEIGAPQLLGGFTAGLALSRRFYLPLGAFLATDHRFAQEIEVQMKPIIHLFTPIFFVTVGLSLNLQEIDWSSPFVWVFSSGMFLIAVAGKIFSAFFIKAEWLQRWAIGLAMVPRGEIGLIFAELGRQSQIFNNEIYAGMIIVIALTTLLPPFILKWFYTKYHHF
ncbi:MAG: cation:proton antiporter [Gammaproteobacteria bacterium]